MDIPAQKPEKGKCNFRGVGYLTPSFLFLNYNVMSTKIQQALIAGMVGTAVMSFFMFMAPMMGIPKMNTAEMLSSIMGFPVFVGWFVHFMIGITFALSYVFFFNNFVKKIKSVILKGIVFGIAVFIFAQVMMGIMDAMIGGMPAMEGSLVLIMIGSIAGHLVFGIVVALLVREKA